MDIYALLAVVVIGVFAFFMVKDLRSSTAGREDRRGSAFKAVCIFVLFLLLLALNLFINRRWPSVPFLFRIG